MVSYPMDFITPSSKYRKHLRRRLSLSAARTDNAHVATAASSWHQQRKQLVEKGCHWSWRPTLSCGLLSKQCHG